MTTRQLLFSILIFSVSAHASFDCNLRDLGKQAEQGFQCTSVTGNNVCIRIESSNQGHRKIQVKNELDSYNQYFEETVNTGACSSDANNKMSHCRMSIVTMDSQSIAATTSSMDFESNSIYRAAFLFDTSTLQGKFNLLSRSGFQNDWAIQDSFNNCKLIK